MDTTTKRIRTLQRVKKTIENKTRKNNTSWIIPAQELHKRLVYTRGNKKIGTDTLIFSISTATDCIAHSVQCCAVCNCCYAKKSEQRFCASYLHKLNQQRQFIICSIDELITLFSKVIDASKTNIKYIRWNEAGELRNYNDFEKINAISEAIGQKYNIQSYIYTSRADLVEQMNIDEVSRHLTVNTSFTNNKGLNSFVAVDKIPTDAIACTADCRNCTLCKTTHGKTVYCKKH